MTDIDKINDKMFKEAFQKPENTKAFLDKVLPEAIKKRIDFSTMEVGPTNYISKGFKEYFSDIVVKTKMISKTGGKIPTDICFILEHKTVGKKRVFIQFLGYMVEEWRKDTKKNKPLRVIIPIVFYHGKKEWKISRFFVEQFDVDDELKEFLLNYRYILFDTHRWDFRDESNETLKKNVFLLTAMALMKCAYTDDTETIEEIFRFWHEKGFTGDIENVVFFLTYISETKNLGGDQIKKMLDKSKIDGGKIMQTLAQQLREEGKKIGVMEGKKKGKLEAAIEFLKNGVDIDVVVKSTGFPRKEIEKLAATIH